MKVDTELAKITEVEWGPAAVRGEEKRGKQRGPFSEKEGARGADKKKEMERGSADVFWLGGE